MTNHTFLVVVERHVALNEEEGEPDMVLVECYGDFGEASFTLNPESAQENYPRGKKLLVTVEHTDE